MSLPIISEAELSACQKPAQYVGGERGSVMKDDAHVDLHVCLAFPDTYEVGMSHIGMQILYDLINREPRFWAERAYQPLPDMEALIRRRGAQLSSLESKRPLGEFDVVGFSLQYELSGTGILTILDLGGIPLLAAARDDSHPLVIAGGPVCYHPEPWADFIDAFLVGDGEELVPEFLERVRELKQQGLGRLEILQELTAIQGVYIPRFFAPQFDGRGAFTGMLPLLPGYEAIRRRIIPSLEGAPFPRSPVVPNIKAVHDRLSVEVMRGCVRGCRFCQAGYLYRPQRERSPEEILEIVGDSLTNTGYEELSLLSLSTADSCSILPLLSALKSRFADNDELAISFPSTRVDALTPELLQEVQPVRRAGFTIAPEAGTQRLRDVINKGVTDEQIIQTTTNVFRLGWQSVKMYFMIGLPTETDEDILGIVDIARRVKQIAGPRHDVTVSVSTLVPKPHTPFQWAEQIPVSETLRRQELLREGLHRCRVTFRYHDAESSFLEGVFARGDRSLGRALLRAYELGCRLDGWTEEMQFEHWMQAFEEVGIEPHHSLHARDTKTALPWDHISCDIPKRYFAREWERSVGARTTPDCLTQSCSVCGACDYDATRNVLFDREQSERRLGIVNPPWTSIIEARARGEEFVPDPSSALERSRARREQAGGYTLREELQTERSGVGLVAEPESPPVQFRYRLQFTKEGRCRFIGHLELSSVFFRAARRAGLPLAYSRGFHPLPRLAFGPALPLSMESRCEFVDASLTEERSSQEIIDSLNRELPAGIQILDATPVTNGTPSIQASIAAWRFATPFPTAESRERVLSLLESNGWRTITVQTTRPGKHYVRTFQLGDEVTELRADEALLFLTLKLQRGSASLPAAAAFRALFALPEDTPLSITKVEVLHELAHGSAFSAPQSAEVGVPLTGYG